MHVVYGSLNNTVYHLFSDPDYYRAAEVCKLFVRFYPKATISLGPKLAPSWVATGRASAHQFSRAYWGSGVILELKANRA